jgi:hypothetical protein
MVYIILQAFCMYSTINYACNVISHDKHFVLLHYYFQKYVHSDQYGYYL